MYAKTETDFNIKYNFFRTSTRNQKLKIAAVFKNRACGSHTNFSRDKQVRSAILDIRQLLVERVQTVDLSYSFGPLGTHTSDIVTRSNDP